MRKKVLFVDHDIRRSGSSVSLEYIVSAFCRCGYDVFVYTPKKAAQAGPLVEAGATLLLREGWHPHSLTLSFHFTNRLSPLSWNGLRTNMKELIKFFLGIIIVTRMIKATRVDLVYVNEYTVLQAYVAAYFCKIPCVVHVRSPMIRGTFGVRRWFVSRCILNLNDLVFAITEREAKQLCARTSERDKIRVVKEFFADVALRTADQNTLRDLFGLPREHKVLSMLGGILEIKGTLDFLRAAEHVSARRKDVVFVVAGKQYRDANANERAYYDQCMRLCANPVLANNVKVFDEIPNAFELIAVSDIVVSTTTETHFSRPIIEAWGFGKPVIATKTDHHADLITHGVDGILFAVHDCSSLAEQMLELLEDEQLCRRLGQAGRTKVSTEFDAETNTKVIVNSCEALLV